MLFKDQKNFAQMSNMIVFTTAIEQDIIEINNKLPQERFQYLIHTRMKVLGALDSPKGMTNHSYNPSFVLKVFFHSSPSLIRI